MLGGAPGAKAIAPEFLIVSEVKAGAGRDLAAGRSGDGRDAGECRGHHPGDAALIGVTLLSLGLMGGPFRLGLWVAPFAVERCRLASPVRRFQPGDELRG